MNCYNFKGEVSVLIPVYNEEKKIDKTLDHLSFSWIKEIIVINDGSTDGTTEKISKYPITLINFNKNKGKGKAINRGLIEAKGDYILFLDGDLGKSVIHVEQLVNTVLENEYEMAVAILPIKGGGIGLLRYLAKHSLYLLTGEKMKAPLSGQRIFKKELLSIFYPLEEGFGMEMGMNLQMMVNSVDYKEIPCPFSHNYTGHSITDYIHRSKQLIAVARVIIKNRKLVYDRFKALFKKTETDYS